MIWENEDKKSSNAARNSVVHHVRSKLAKLLTVGSDLEFPIEKKISALKSP